jgi:hypothetical protein|tara:strand:+ start:255 stop:449 length:195 start_codon:yes stop_codon:yes gene_type:complete
MNEPYSEIGVFEPSLRWVSRDNVEFLRFDENGDFLVKGKKIINDIEIYHAMKAFLEDAGYLKGE